MSTRTARNGALLAMLVALSAGPQVAAAQEQECAPLDRNVARDDMRRSEYFQEFLIFDDLRGRKRTVLAHGRCYELVRQGGERNITIVFNHRSNREEKEVGFLAAQVIKFSNVAGGYADPVYGTRRGNWRLPGATQAAPERKGHFKGANYGEFVEWHAGERVSIDDIEAAFGDAFHGVPVGGTVNSAKDRKVWVHDQPPDGSYLINNYLIRYETVPKGETPARNKFGIPFEFSVPTSVETVVVKMFVPGENQRYVEIKLDNTE